MACCVRLVCDVVCGVVFGLCLSCVVLRCLCCLHVVLILCYGLAWYGMVWYGRV